jgi:hypothetical protein
MRLTEQSRYALRVLAHCAERHPSLAKVATIAAVTGITEQNIFKLIKVLTKAAPRSPPWWPSPQPRRDALRRERRTL